MASAHDMNSMRLALGEEKISYFGFSNGSKLGATWATMFPSTVRAAVLDGTVDPNASTIEEVYANIEISVAAAPRLSANFAYGYSCALWPVAQAERITITGKGAGPIVVIGTTGDAATPLSSTRNMPKGLEQGILIVV